MLAFWLLTLPGEKACRLPDQWDRRGAYRWGRPERGRYLTRGAGKIDWADTAAGEGDAAMFADAPFVVGNETAHACARRRSGRGMAAGRSAR